MSEVKCAKCNKGFLLLKIKHTHIFSLKDIGIEDVIPEQKVDAEGTKYLECMFCGWRGWIDEYWQMKEGVIPLFDNFTKGVYENID